jgi:uncharacterized membrane protein
MHDARKAGRLYNIEMEKLGPWAFKPRVFNVEVGVIVVFQALALPLTWAGPPNGRMNPDERQRLRQEVRQHSGAYPRQQALPAVNPGAQPLGVPQANPVSSALPGAGAPGGAGAAYGPPGAGQRPGQGGGRLSEDDRRALRQQLREQRAQRDMQTVPVMNEAPKLP